MIPIYHVLDNLLLLFLSYWHDFLQLNTFILLDEIHLLFGHYVHHVLDAECVHLSHNKTHIIRTLFGVNCCCNSCLICSHFDPLLPRIMDLFMVWITTDPHDAIDPPNPTESIHFIGIKCRL
eukprot:206036_1